MSMNHLSHTPSLQILGFHPVFQRLQQFGERLFSYQCQDSWNVSGTVEEVGRMLFDTAGLPQWWRQFRHVEVTRKGGENGVGRTFCTLVKGFLPYALRLTFEVTDADFPRHFTVTIDGDFQGRGCGRLTKSGDQVRLDFDMQIHIRRPLIRVLWLLAKPILAAQHTWTMAWGAARLNAELVRRRSLLEAA